MFFNPLSPRLRTTLPPPPPRRSPQAADDFSSFLDKENELEVVGGAEAGGATTTSADLRHRDPQRLRPSAAAGSPRESPQKTEEAAFGRVVERERRRSPSPGNEEKGEKQEDEEGGRRRRGSHPAVIGESSGDAAVCRGDEFEFDGSGSAGIDDVSKPMPRRGAEPESLAPGEGKRGEGGRGGVGLSLSSILHQSKGPTLLGDSGEEAFFSGVVGTGEDTPRRDSPGGSNLNG